MVSKLCYVIHICAGDTYWTGNMYSYRYRWFYIDSSLER